MAIFDRIDLLNTVLHTYLQDTGIILFNRGLYVEQEETIQRLKRIQAS